MARIPGAAISPRGPSPLSDPVDSQPNPTNSTMNLTLLLSTFVTVFLAELGDKTQLATVAISGTSDRPLAVFLGSSSALVIASLIGAVAGGSLSAIIPADWIQLSASIGFLVIGLRLLWPKLNTESGVLPEQD